ncbi:MAG: hypothetical protein WCK00_12860, partial [Deltaproteobacteria bacterium]
NFKRSRVIPMKKVKDMTPEERERHEQSKARRKKTDEYHKKLDNYIFEILGKMYKDLKNASNHVKELESVEDVINEGEKIGGRAFAVSMTSPEAYNESISKVIQKAEALIEKLKSLQRSEYNPSRLDI